MTTSRRLLHFCGFRGDEYGRAVRIFGRPDMIHFHHDRRAVADFAPGDTVVFAHGCESFVSEYAVEPDF